MDLEVGGSSPLSHPKECLVYYTKDMKKILLDGNEVKTLVPENLPMLIHGKEGSGASLYTICLAAKWFSQGYKVLFLCGHQMAEQEFRQQVSIEQTSAKFYTQDKVNEFIEELRDVTRNTIVIIKNIELFDIKLFDAIRDVGNLIISGEIDKTVLKGQLLSKKFVTEVYFSPLNSKEVPQLERFQGYVISDDYKGTTQLQ